MHGKQLEDTNSFSNDKISDSSMLKLYEEENIVRKEEMLVSIIFSISKNVFISLLSRGIENLGLFGKGQTLNIFFFFFLSKG